MFVLGFGFGLGLGQANPHPNPKQVRLNLWGLLYVLLAGWLRFGRAGRASWLAARAVLAVSIALQYAAGVSLPPSVWAEPARRPWDTWGAGWPAGAETCARLGSNATTTDGKVGE